jgi:hypothetical protein
MRSARRVPIGPLVAGAGAVLLIVTLFLDWYDEFTAWTIFEVLDLVLAGVALAALVCLAGELGVGPARRWAFGAEALLPLGAIALVVVASQLVNHPPAADDLDKEMGAWLALAAAAVMLAGAVLATIRISLALDVEPREPAGPAERGTAAPAARRPAATDPDAPTVPRPGAPARPAGGPDPGAPTAPPRRDRPQGPPP